MDHLTADAEARHLNQYTHKASEPLHSQGHEEDVDHAYVQNLNNLQAVLGTTVLTVTASRPVDQVAKST